MRTLILALLLFAPTIGDACSIAHVFEPECQKNPDGCLRRDLKRMYERAHVVFEVTVDSSEKASHGRYLHRVKILHTWKTDGGALDIVEAGSGSGDCTISLDVGKTYLVFSHRLERKGSFLRKATKPLYAGIERTFQPAEFAAKSAYHAALYNAKSAQSLQQVLESLER